MACTAAEAIKFAADLPALLDLYASFENALLVTKGQSPVERDFSILEAVLPKLKALAVTIEAQMATP